MYARFKTTCRSYPKMPCQRAYLPARIPVKLHNLDSNVVHWDPTGWFALSRTLSKTTHVAFAAREVGVGADDVMALAEQILDEVRTDKPRATGHQHALACRIAIGYPGLNICSIGEDILGSVGCENMVHLHYKIHPLNSKIEQNGNTQCWWTILLLMLLILLSNMGRKLRQNPRLWDPMIWFQILMETIYTRRMLTKYTTLLRYATYHDVRSIILYNMMIIWIIISSYYYKSLTWYFNK